MKILPNLGFNELVSKFSSRNIVNSGRDVIPNRIGGIPNHKIMDTFSDIVTNLITSSSINNINSNTADTGITPVNTDSLDGVQASVSSDGKLSAPISKASIKTEMIDEQTVEKTSKDGNTIKLGSSSFKSLP